MALEEILVSYFDRLADRVADRILQRLAARGATAGDPRSSALDALPGVDVPEHQVGTPVPARRPVQAAPTQDRPQPGGTSLGTGAVTSGQPVVDAPPTPHVSGVGPDGRRAVLTR